MKKILVLLCCIPFAALAQIDTVLSGAYQWQQPALQKNKLHSIVLLEGRVHDFEWMQITANSLGPSPEKIQLRVPESQEQLLIVKSGVLQIGIGDSTFALNAGSVAVIMPGEAILVNSIHPSSFYVVKYRSKTPKNLERGKMSGGSFVKFWDEIPYKPNNNGGGRRDFFERGTAMQKRFEMHVTTLKEGNRSHAPHTHRAEEIVLVMEGDTEMQIGEKIYPVKPGGFYYLGSNVLHAIKTTGTKPSTYFAIQFE